MDNKQNKFIELIKSGGLTKFVKIFIWIIFIVFITTVIISALSWEDSLVNVILGVVLYFGLAFLIVALITILLDMSEDIKAIRKNTQKKNDDTDKTIGE